MSGRETKAPRFAWKVMLASGQTVYAKAESDAGDDAALVTEAWAMERARAVGFPAPAVLALDTSETIFPGPLLVMAECPGKALAPLWRSPGPDEAALDDATGTRPWFELGRRVRPLHEVRLAGFGRLNGGQFQATGEVRGRQRAWRAYSSTPATAALADPEFTAHLAPDVVSTSRRALASLADESERPETVLLHGELCAKHTFVDPDTGRLQGVIDFGDAEVGPPAWEFANIALWEDDLRLDAALAGYDAPATFRRQVIALAIVRGLALAHRRFREGRTGATDPFESWLAPRLEQF